MVSESMLDRVGDVLRQTAACVVMPRFGALGPGDTHMKAIDDPVTIADREAEQMIATALASLLPAARVVGEEACASDPTLLAGLDQGDIWVIDPIDGTANFAAARAPFAMMVALLREGQTIASWILDPLSDTLAVARRGGGAWIAGRRVTASNDDLLPDRLRGIVSTAFVPPEQRHRVEAVRAAVGRVDPTARCAGHEYPLVARGERDFILYWRTLIWDHAPGALLLTEAGGLATGIDGSPYRPSSMKPGLLLAHNPLISSRMLDLLGRREHNSRAER